MILLGKAWRHVTWYVGQLMGDSAYENYLARHRVRHPDHEPMSKREFWRDRIAFDETNHSTGCC